MKRPKDRADAPEAQTLTPDGSSRDPRASAPDARPMARKRRRGRFLVPIIVLLLIVGCSGLIWARSVLSKPVAHHSADKVITIDPGIGTHAIIARLSQAGIVRRPRVLEAYLFVTHSNRSLKAGDYKFPTPISPLEAIDRIRRGEVAYERVTVPEGFNRFEIADLLAAKTEKATATEFLSMMDDVGLIADIDPRARNLEGYLFPDTYSYTSRTSPEELIHMMVHRFREVFTPEMAARAGQENLTLRQAVTLASI
ncbi:MAG TPA: endolytic transglycosylase MltG, partial [Blastocatellia bacterium]